MAVKTFTRMAVAYGNKTSPGNISAMVSSGITSFVSGFPLSNIEIPDSWTTTKTSVISGQPIIEFQFAASHTINVMGIINHTINGADYPTIAVERWNGSSWDAVASMTQPQDTRDIWVAWDTSTSASRFRFKLGSGVGPNFMIGQVFWGFYRQVDQNPLIMNQALSTPLVVETATGGAKYITFGAEVRTAVLELTWSRAKDSETEFWFQRGKYELLGILTPEHSDATTVILGQEIFWGYVKNRTMTPRGPGSTGSTQAKYDMTIALEGAS